MLYILSPFSIMALMLDMLDMLDHFFFFLSVPARHPISEIFHGRNYTYFSLILSRYICWLYNYTILEMNTHSKHVISKVALFFFFSQ